MPKGTDFNAYFRESMKDPEARRLYREVLDEELSWLLSYLRRRGGFPRRRWPSASGSPGAG